MKKDLGRLRTAAERRAQPRREQDDREVIASHWAFDRHERMALKQLERRRQVRRRVDVTAQIARAG